MRPTDDDLDHDQQEAQRQALQLRGAPEEADALDFIEAVADLAD